MADYIRPTPRNPILGLLADALTGSVQYMRDPQRAQQMQGLGGLLAETGIPATMERLSYGEPLTKGKGMTTRLRPEAEAALMTLGPEAVPIGRGAMAGVKATKGLPVGAGIRQVAPQEEALRLAQQRAALPVSEGGLGLPANNTPMDRARAMGFDTDVYHGTDFDIKNLDRSFLGINTSAPSAKKAFFSAGHPRTTYAYIDDGVTGNDAVFSFLYGKSGDKIFKEIEQEALKKGLETYQIRDQYFESLPNLYEKQMQDLKNKKLEVIKQIPFKQVLGRRIPDMGSATQQQKQLLNAIDDSIEELTATRDMVIRQPKFSNEIDDIEEVTDNYTKAGGNIMPLKLRAQNAQYFDDANQGYRSNTFSERIDEAIQNKKDLAIIQNTQDGFKKSDTIYGVINPEIVRSRFAAFDPTRRNEPDLLAGVLPFTALLDEENRALLEEQLGGLLGR